MFKIQNNAAHLRRDNIQSSKLERVIDSVGSIVLHSFLLSTIKNKEALTCRIYRQRRDL